MRIFNHYYSFLCIGLIIFSCKATRTDQSNSHTDTDELEAPGTVIRSGDIIMVNKELKETLEAYFKLFSTMDMEDIELRDQKREEVFNYFYSPDTPVYFVLYNSEGERYYDKPTTISEYLHYLRDTGQAPHFIQNVILDETQERIRKMELAVK